MASGTPAIVTIDFGATPTDAGTHPQKVLRGLYLNRLLYGLRTLSKRKWRKTKVVNHIGDTR